MYSLGNISGQITFQLVMWNNALLAAGGEMRGMVCLADTNFKLPSGGKNLHSLCFFSKVIIIAFFCPSVSWIKQFRAVTANY